MDDAQIKALLAETRERVALHCAMIADTLTVQVGSRPAEHAPYYWIADEIREQYGLNKPQAQVDGTTQKTSTVAQAK